MARLALAIGVLLSGCSALLEFDPNEQPCREGECAEGYTCRGNDRCIRNGSLDVGDACTDDVLCGSGLLCAKNRPRVCAKPCPNADGYTRGSVCPEGYFCRPERRPAVCAGDDPGCPEDGYSLRSLCIPDQCKREPRECSAADMACIDVASLASECMRICSGGASSCSDPSADVPQACVPLVSRLVCVEIGEPSVELAQEGAPCSVPERMCPAGWACVTHNEAQGCHRLCAEDADCGGPGGLCLDRGYYRYCAQQ